ncbi:hypothetical protein B9G54_00475 [Alloscardovia macacae]|uniref:GNAT-like C-terminal domain-containing protein n=2 Tax=Alloscardovia macacae TaxID=1160091 RepID=A0A1Y2SWR2_9BIFI|nr:hypothetical protein B9G54_00475 [Alloscardovia macacae]OTA30230.1 hypothetical protein B9T39_00555 [Alloscardovia macacae]
MLFIALHFTLPAYRKRGLEDEIFTDTMRAFPRFVCENKKRYGNYSFDREFWAYRQLALRIFRIGTLEYELSKDKQNAYISIHIPSDADLLPESVSTSVHSAKEWISNYFPDYRDALLRCESWMLNPVLPYFLTNESKIVSFQRLFDITAVNPDSEDWREWVFDGSSLPIELLPEDTSLRKAIKRHMREKGEFGNGVGVMMLDRI